VAGRPGEAYFQTTEAEIYRHVLSGLGLDGVDGQATSLLVDDKLAHAHHIVTHTWLECAA